MGSCGGVGLILPLKRPRAPHISLITSVYLISGTLYPYNTCNVSYPLVTPSHYHRGRRQGDLIPRATSLPAWQIAAAAAASTGRGGGGAQRLKG